MKSLYLQCGALVLASIGAVDTTPLARGDDSATVFQYEVRPGSRKQVSTIYLAYRPGGPSRVSASATDHAASIRIPVYSSDPRVPTTLSRISLLRRAADGGAMTTGDVVGGVIGFALYVGLPAYAVGKRIHEASDMDLDLSGIEVPDIPEVPPTDSANEKQ